MYPGADPEASTTDGKRYFCYINIKLNSQCYIGGFLCLITLLLFLRSIFQYYKTTKIPTVNYIVRLIYFTIFTWSILYTAKIILSEYLLLIFEQQWQDSQPQDVYQNYSISSKKVFVLDITCIFLVQAVLILVCYNWTDNIVRQLKRLIQIGDNFNDDNEQRVSNLTESYGENLAQSTTTERLSRKKKPYQQLRYEIISRNILRFYLVFRFLVYFLVIPFIIVKDQHTQTIIVKQMIISLLVEGVMVLIVLTIGVSLIINNKKLKQLVNQEDINLMVNQYSILIICSLIRLVFDVIFCIYNFGPLDNYTICIPNDLSQNAYGEHIAKFVLQATFTHFIPILVVLRIYNVKNNHEELRDSLMAVQKGYQNQ